ncbi:very-long-chain (3R)-3-hydroxyacyl-CoA dehydratase 2 [Ischnura elegans]|uniref:very-long-chain (3R)-3-hydroxyacyl-CoA dehydratase 2 n=1 Tax=Ischnura elegans TaxID=197161 RepID=UPI001ED88CF7|nr:very-long-chain (3R)-3-hydroxyacyl-CoA dehydratase 2 [Ischnura elegans]
MAGKTTKKAEKGPGILLKGYLFLYNFAQVLGWSYIFYLILEYYFVPTSHENLWESVKFALIIFQNAAVLEIIHAALRFVPSNVMITTFQVLSRVMAVCGVLIPFEESQKSIGLLLLLFAWTITEIIRYSYYAVNIVGNVPYFIIWCRYTFFIVLYPIGVTGELISLYYAQESVAHSKLWTVEMPNYLNVTFSYRYFLLFTMFLYLPLFPQMYLHMFSQRRKIIGGEPSKKAKTK